MITTLYVCLAASILVISRLAFVWRAQALEQRQTDLVSGLPNRAGFEAIVAGHVKSGLPFSVIWLNLDGFRKLNELHGYASGDVLLGQIGPRIRRCLRTGDAAARFGGDQFLVLLCGHDATAAVAARILSTVKATAGVSLYPDHADNPSDLLLLAETAMLKAKANARGRALFYDPAMAASGLRSAEIASLIQSALANDHFRLVYQPIVDSAGRIMRMEALVRIDDPVLGRVAPGEFIGVAEQTGLIHEVGIWILRSARRQAHEWQEAGLKTQVTINLSPIQLGSIQLAEAILGEISQCGLERAAITVHLTGTVESKGPVERLRAAGVVVSSHESIFDEIRVKAPFLIPAAGHRLTVIAQGIEKPEQLDQAHAAGCHLFQGFQIAPPLEPNDATAILRSGLFAGLSDSVSR
jgi:predicted signal transduction protein with EAL and GGDEF domain